MKNNIIECRNVSKTFYTKKRKKEVVSKIDLMVQENEFVALFGPGQCGKTTILNMIAGLEQATDGEIYVNGKQVTEPRPDIGVVYQDILLFDWLSVMKNVSYGPRMQGMGKKEREKLAQHYIDLVGLGGFEKAFPSRISGGMKQRVGIARAYCNNPVILLMDEPFGHLDAQTRYLMQEELQKIWQKEKRTVVFITNNLEEAIYLADRIVVLDECPTKIKKEFVIDMPRPRDYVSKPFMNYRQEITKVLGQKA